MMGKYSYRFIVLDDTTHSLLLVDGPTGDIIAEIPYPPECTPTELTLTPNLAKVYIPATNKQGDGVLFVASLAEKSIYRLPITMPQPIQFALSPDATCAYIADPDGGLYMLEFATMSLKNLGNRTNSSCVGLVADSTALYSVWEGESGILAVHTATGEFLSEHILTGIPTNITLDACGHIFIPFTTTNFTIEGILFFNRIMTDNQTPAVVATHRCIYPYSTSPSAAYPSHVATWKDEPIAYVVNEENASITVINSQTAAIIRHIEIGRSISCLHILPGGQFGIATSHILSDLCLIDLQNSRLLSTTDTKRQLLGYIGIIPIA